MFDQLKVCKIVVCCLVLFSLLAQGLSSWQYRKMESSEPEAWSQSLEGMQRKTKEYHLQAGVNSEKPLCLWFRVANTLLSVSLLIAVCKFKKLLKELKKI